MKHSIKVSLQPVKDSDLFPVRLRVAWSGCRCDLSLGVSYNVGKWFKEIGRAKTNSRNSLKQSATEVNGLIEDAVRWVDSYFVKAYALGLPVTTKDLKTAFVSDFRGKGGNVDKTGGILALFDRFYIETAKLKGWVDNTCKKYSSLRSKLARYEITAADFNADFFNVFVGDEIKNGLKNTTIRKDVILLKSFGRWLFENDFIKEDLSRFSVRLKWSGGNNKAVVFLEWSEVKALLSAADGSLSGTIELTVDMFLFSCFTGLRFSDVRGLRVSDIKNGKIYVVTKKTSDSLEIELNKYSTKIFEKYKSVTPDGFLFPPVSIQLANRNLKAIFLRLGLSRAVKKISFSGSERSERVVPLCEAISFHAGRRTFVVECLRRGISPSVIMKWTGHSDYSAMKPYIAIVDTLKASEMSKFNN
ncbi:MAG: tyrosine-type recombinase/integrase [Bacteroidales bacterium]|nr:tyrosine-type recombinase/integrase [Bacteroidales bacterium]